MQGLLYIFTSTVGLGLTVKCRYMCRGAVGVTGSLITMAVTGTWFGVELSGAAVIALC